MPYLAFWMNHRSREQGQMQQLATFLCEPIFDAFNRTAMVVRDKRVGRGVKSISLIDEQLNSKDSRGVELDNGGKEYTASAYFVFDDADGLATYPAPHSGNLVVPYEPENLVHYLRAFKRVFIELDGVLGYISVEPSPDEAQSVGLGMDNRVTRDRNDISELRRRERKAQMFSLREFATKIPAVHWGMFISAGHLDSLNVASIAASSAFYQVDMLDDGKCFLQLTPDPMSALAPTYEAELDEARKVLAPIRIDVSDIELTSREDDA